jgi:hypothetical protein
MVTADHYHEFPKAPGTKFYHEIFGISRLTERLLCSAVILKGKKGDKEYVMFYFHEISSVFILSPPNYHLVYILFN